MLCKQLPQNLRRKGLRPQAITMIVWLCPAGAILPQTLQVLLVVREGRCRKIGWFLIPQLHRPTVSPTKNSLVYFISIVYTDHPVWRSHREEAKRGPPSGHRITRNGAAMVSLLLPYATTGLSRIAGRCLIGATPRGQPRTPVSCTVRRPFSRSRKVRGGMCYQ